MSKRSFSKGPSRKANLELGGLPLRKKASAQTQSLEKSQGNLPTGFIQTTPKKATGSMMGRAPPGPGKQKSPARKSSSQFKPRGKSVF